MDVMDMDVSAFPHQPCGQDGLPTVEASAGMTLRDWFASQSLIAIIQVQGAQFFNDADRQAELAYSYADEMMKARKE